MKGSQNPKRLDGRVVVVTGANIGIGKETAMDLCKRGARVIMLCRSEERAKKAIEDIKAQVQDAKLDLELVDVSSLASVRACAGRLLENESRIDILINNAGVTQDKFNLTEEGFERTFVTNHLGHFLLTELLMPLLKNSKSSGFHPRIVIVSSKAHTHGTMNWEDLNYEKTAYDPVKVYSQSKLANLLHAKELARRLQGTGITVYTLHPGMVQTDIWINFSGSKIWRNWILPVINRLLLITPLQGAQTTLYCALEDAIADESGKYYDDCKEKTPHPKALAAEDQKRLWDISEKMVGLKS